VTGYSAKGGTFNILGNVVDRGWVCAVSDPRGPGLQVNIVGTAYEHLCQAFMGGSVIMLGLYWGNDGILHRMDSPYKGGKILAGASAGEIIFYDPRENLDEAQYKSCLIQPIDQKKWEEIMERLMTLEKTFSLGISRENSHLRVNMRVFDGSYRRGSLRAIIKMKIGQGVKPGIGDYLPGGKSCRGHLEDEDDSQGHRRPLPCPLI
jgi:hypothetical protein